MTIIFDLDGTIVDTEKIWARANQLLLERRGISYTDELRAIIAPQIHGLATHKSCSIIKEVANLSEPLDDLIREKIQIAQSLYRQGIRFIDGFERFHSEVALLNIKSGIATNADFKTVSIADEALNLKRFFGEHIYSISSVNYVCKPDPAIYLYVADKLNARPKECVAIEDSAHGIRAAKKAGMFCIGINTAGNKEALKESDHIVHTYEEIDLHAIMHRKKRS